LVVSFLDFLVVSVCIADLTVAVAYTLPKEKAAKAIIAINFFIFYIFCFRYATP
jgi:hypothetical protein